MSVACNHIFTRTAEVDEFRRLCVANGIVGDDDSRVVCCQFCGDLFWVSLELYEGLGKSTERRISRGWRWLKHILGLEGCKERRNAQESKTGSATGEERRSAGESPSGKLLGS